MPSHVQEEKVEMLPKYAVLHDIPQVTISEVKAQIRISVENKQKRGCVTLVGESGTGKTQCIAQLGEELGCRVIYIYTAHYGLVGTGIPQRAIGDYFRMAVPDVFPKPGEKAIIVFDEINRGDKPAINMFFTMLEAGRMFDYVLPEECLVVATMNPATAQYAVTAALEKEAAFRRRIKFFYIVPDLKGFLSHAESPQFHQYTTCTVSKGRPCHPGILSYFKAKPSHIHDIKAMESNKQYCCPAVIETISEDAYGLEARQLPIYGEFALQRFASSMGLTVAQELTQHLRDSTLTIGAEDILKDFKRVKQGVIKMINDPVLREALIDLNRNVVHLMFATTPDVTKTAENFLKFIEVQPENLAQTLFQQMQPVAEENKAKPYLHSLMRELMNYEEWADLQLRIDKNYRTMTDKVKGN